MGKRTAFFSSIIGRIILLSLVCAVIAGFTIYAIVSSRPLPDASTPEAVSASFSSPASPSSVQSQPSGKKRRSSGNAKKESSVTASDEAPAYSQVISEILQQADTEASSRLAEAESAGAAQARKNQLLMDIAVLDTETQAWEAKKIAAQQQYEALTAQGEAAASEADEDAAQAIADKTFFEQNIRQILATGKNPYELIADADNRYYAAIDKGDEARAAIKAAQAEYDDAVLALDEQINACKNQKNRLEEELLLLS